VFACLRAFVILQPLKHANTQTPKHLNTTLTTLLYDGTFDGLLAAIFESYRLRLTPGRFLPETEFAGDLFEAPMVVAANAEHAGRVKKAVIGRTSALAAEKLYHAFLTEEEGVEMLVFRFIRQALASPVSIEENYLDPDVLRLTRLHRQMAREVHRMHAFVRFQRTRDDLYYAVVEPDFNVLPLLGDHFERRYPAQSWVIYDSRRHYGLHYDQHDTRFVTFDVENHFRLRQLPAETLNAEERSYQTLWKDYFNSVNIPERRNMKLHLQHVPRRYWKYLVER
jgi:probable DNA metabolism protein